MSVHSLHAGGLFLCSFNKCSWNIAHLTLQYKSIINQSINQSINMRFSICKIKNHICCKILRGRTKTKNKKATKKSNIFNITGQVWFAILTVWILSLFHCYIIIVYSLGDNNLKIQITVKPDHVVTSIKQSPILKGHLFLVMSLKVSCELNLFSEVICLKRPLFHCPYGDLLIRAWL